jgi:protein gp37
MADHSKIEWTDATVNVVNGCSLASPGCTNCYAMKLAGTRLRTHPSREGLTIQTKAGPVWNGEVRFNERPLQDVLRWTKPRMIFWNAHGDLFHPSVPDEWIDLCFAAMGRTPHHIHQVLTKRSERMRQYLSARKAAAPVNVPLGDGTLEQHPFNNELKPPSNIWLGVSVEDQQRADERIPDLLSTPAAIRWLSCEPLLGPVDLEYPASIWPDGPADCCSGHECGCMGRPIEPPLIYGLNWVVAGGESGSRARPMHPEWARSLRDQCEAVGVPFFFKQFGEWMPSELCALDCSARDILIYDETGKVWREAQDDGGWIGDQAMCRVGKKRAGRLLDGVEHNGMPEVRS